MKKCIINWEGSGEYAPRQEGDVVRYYVTEGGSRTLGTPEFFEVVPEGFHVYDCTVYPPIWWPEPNG